MSSGILLSPARIHVTRYLKGHGPAVVTVKTGYTREGGGGIINGEGVTPKTGEHWMIYATSARRPYATSVCGGSHRVSRG